MRTSAAELLRVWPRHKTKCDLLKATIKIQINKIAVVNYKFKKGNNDIWACLVATTTQHVQPVADDVTATLRTLCCGGRARGVAANQTESNITGKNNGLINEEPWLMYIYRQGLPGR
jgi:hypothetical protein